MNSVGDDDLATVLRALGHPVRLRILRFLSAERDRDCCCTDVTQCLPLAQSTVSQHIKVLLDAGLIERHARGTRNCYALRMSRIAQVESACAGLFTGLVPSAPVRELA
jgi:ArsR family transcriptional regulator, arsenate/arsenite/antimonite-responsive transcriptional repressor